MGFDVKKNVVITMAGKMLILLANFLAVVLSTRLWGAEGKGIITMFVADVSLLAIVSNVFVGSSASYHISRGTNKLFTMALTWALIVPLLGATLFRFAEEETLSFAFFLATSLLSVYAFFNSLYIGEQRIAQYNLLTVLQPVLLIVFLLLFYYFVDDSCNAYIYAMIASYGILNLYSLWKKRGRYTDSYSWDWQLFRETFVFGLQNELSNFLQFFNARLSYYFLNYYAGTASVGVYSIGVTISEALWVVSRSFSTVQYSRLLKEKNDRRAVESTKAMAQYCGIITLGMLLVMNLMPETLFVWVFGAEFAAVKQVLLIMSPGIFTVSLSYIFDHYFTAKGKLRILMVKSLAGVAVTVVCSIFLIRKYQMNGAVWVNLLSNLVTSSVLIFAFLYEVKKEKN